MEHKDINNQISCYLKEYFKENNISQKDIQSDLGVSQQYVSGIINGKRSIGKKLAEKLSELYGLNKSILLTGEKTSASEAKTSNSEIKNLPHDKQMEILHNNIMELKEENEELKDMIDHLTLTMEISLAPILRHFKLKADDYEKLKKDRNSVN
ncbi:helix-turn-helix domain-containing protein [Chryseobacterium sp. JK1]|uniref:helix-turn-helix domain-containing protein n=1 Tax=Chryseobacterium sp. JK1 TaxID=874294 RepID=UPI003D695B85